jgi:hypothetical protein
MCRFVPQVVSHLRLFHLCPHPSSPSTGANDIRRKLLSPLEFLRLCEFEDGSDLFFFFLNQFIFRNTSLRLGPVCIYEPIQIMRHSNNEVPTQRVRETKTVRGAERG